MNTLLRSTQSTLRRQIPLRSPTKRFASTTTMHSTSPKPSPSHHYTPIQWMKKFVPVEAYPLIFLASSMTCFGLYHGYSRLVHVPGELRLLPERFQDEGKEPWEEDRVKQGIW